MSQEYTEDKDISLQPLSNGRRLLEAWLIMVALFSVYLMVALLSFNPSDPSWSQTAWHEPIHNVGGAAGAWLADTLLFSFGVMAYAIPPVVLGLCWITFRQPDQRDYFDYFAVALRLIGMLALVVTTCGLAAINADDIWYFASGGVIGSLVSYAMTPWFNTMGGTLTLLCLWAAGLTLYTGWSWLMIAEKIGTVVMGVLSFVTRRSRHESRWDEDDALLTGTAPHNKNSGDSEDARDPLLMKVVTAADATAKSSATAVMKPSPALHHVEMYEVTTHVTPPDTEEVKIGSVAENLHGTFAEGTTSINNSVSSDTDNSTPQLIAELAKAEAASEALEGASNPNSQVKLGMGPELPRPNPVRLPTRRELASWGITLPSQRLAQEKVKGEQAQQQTFAAPASSLIVDENQVQMQALQLPDAFVIEQPGGDRFSPKVSEQTLMQVSLTEQPQRDEEFQAGLSALDSEHDAEIIADSEAFSSASTTPLCSAEQKAETGNSSFYPLPSLHSSHSQQGGESETTALLPGNSAASDSEPPGERAEFAVTDHTVNSISNSASCLQTEAEISAQPQAYNNSLIHPFLIRHEQPLHKPSTPLPQLSLLSLPPREKEPVDMFALEQTARLVEARLADYRVKAEVVGISPGPVITRFELDLAPGVKAARISSLSRDLARSLSAVAVRVVEVIPGKPYVGLELPNKHRQTVYLSEVLDCTKFRDNPSPLSVVLGKDIAGQPVVADLTKMPHLLVAGTTGSGKSVGVNAMILSMLYKATPEEVRFIMIDPKMLELSVYEGIPHLLTEVVTDMKDAANALRWSVGEMERRYKLMSALGVRNLAGYNEKIAQAALMERPIPDPFWKAGDSMDSTPPVLEKLPYIVVLVDEFADLMMAVGKKVEELIARLAQKARAAGIHLVLATQRPSVDVITGLIKANIPTRIAFTVSSKIDSRTILDQMGAESLLGMGDMLYLAPNSSIPVRVHGAFVRDEEVHAVVQDWKARGRPQYIDSITSGDESESATGGFESEDPLDPLFDQAVAFVVEKRRASISGVQRQFRIGYNRAARIIEQMEVQSIVSAPGHNGNREVLSPPAEER